jgi:hypothetical protein
MAADPGVGQDIEELRPREDFKKLVREAEAKIKGSAK